jgi:hypothetical protein
MFVGVLFLTGWLLKAYAFTPIASGPAPAPTQAPAQAQAPTQEPTRNTWCLVGENTLGRLCTQSACSNGFPSKEACEYTEASALPLGVTGQGGLFYHPFMSREVRYTTF